MELRGVRPLTVTVLAFVASIGLGACGSAAPEVPAAAAAPPTSVAPAEYQAPPGDSTDVADTFRRYNKALLARDFTTACGLTSPGAVQTLVAAVKKQGGKATSCDQAFRALYASATASATADAVSRAITVTKVTMDGDLGRVDWSASGRTSTAEFQKLDGVWKLLPPRT
jgi:hypothetical protein